MGSGRIPPTRPSNTPRRVRPSNAATLPWRRGGPQAQRALDSEAAAALAAMPSRCRSRHATRTHAHPRAAANPTRTALPLPPTPTPSAVCSYSAPALRSYNFGFAGYPGHQQMVEPSSAADGAPSKAPAAWDSYRKSDLAADRACDAAWAAFYNERRPRGDAGARREGGKALRVSLRPMGTADAALNQKQPGAYLAEMLCGQPGSAAVRGLVAKHGLPSAHRAAVWMAWSGAGAKQAAHPRGYFRRLHRAESGATSADLAEEVRQIELDVPRTCPNHAFFRSSVGRACLHRVLRASAGVRACVWEARRA